MQTRQETRKRKKKETSVRTAALEETIVEDAAHGNNPLGSKDQAAGNQERVGDKRPPCATGIRYAVVGNKEDAVRVGEANLDIVDGDMRDVVRLGWALSHLAAP